LAWQRQIISGDPGTRWVNDTQRVQYQFVPSFIKTCGLCLQYTYKIGAIWGIPLHHGCRCRQDKIIVGAEAPHEFADFREILDAMDHADQVAAIGASNYRLLKEGVVEWKDIVTPSRVRDLREVVANKRLSIKTMVDAGINPKIAAAAHATVNTPEHVLAEQRQMQLVQAATASGARLEDLTKQLGEKIATRVSIAAGPDTYGAGPAWTGGPITPKGPAPSQADLLLSALEKIRARDAAIAKAKAEAAKPPAIPAPSPEQLESIPEVVRPEKLGRMEIDIKARNEEIKTFLEAHPSATPTEVTITPALRDKVMGQFEHWIRSGSEQDLAKLKSVLGAESLPPPIVQFYSSGNVGVPDGFHRLVAAVLRGQTSIKGYVIGTPDVPGVPTAPKKKSK
jgi:hypothetical protein